MSCPCDELSPSALIGSWLAGLGCAAVDRDGEISEEDFIAFLGVTSPQQHQISIAHHVAIIKGLEEQVVACEQAASAAMKTGAYSCPTPIEISTAAVS